MSVSSGVHDEARASLLGAHRPGRSLAAAVQARQRPLIEARRLLIESLANNPESSKRFAQIFSTRAPQQFTDIRQEFVAERAAWALMNMYLLGAASGAPVSESLRSAEEWFLGSRAGNLPSLADCVDSSVDRACAMLLSVLTVDNEFRELLPYVLEPFDFAHRLNAKRCAEFGKQRRKKRTSGTFYTPGDVAAALVRDAVELVRNGGRALDPACGTGVFLLAVLRRLRASGDSRSSLEICQSALYGIDISDLAIESCAFVLSHECIGARSADPWAVWHAIRLNLWACDATTVRLVSGPADPSKRQRTRDSLLTTSAIPDGLVGQRQLAPPLWQSSDTRAISDVFPEAASGFEVLVSNPPYVRKASGHRNLYIPFVELMLRLAHTKGSFIGAALPLSVAFASDEDTKSLRDLLTRAPGVCRFAFFDREPHGLFGEEVKTRSALLFRLIQEGTGPANVQTTPLMRLTSRTRSELLRAIPSVTLGQVELREGVPKLGNKIEVEAYRKLTSQRWTTDRTVAVSAEAFEFCLADRSDLCVYVGPVAYNFVNVARRLRVPSRPSGSPTRSSFLRCEFPAAKDADAAFALFSSRLFYWLWNVHGDGFHVSRRFVESVLAYWNAFPSDARASLAGLGEQLWEAVSSRPIVSMNAGAWSLAFSPLFHQRLLSDIDAVVAEQLALPTEFMQVLERASVARIVVSPAESKRRRLVG